MDPGTRKSRCDVDFEDLAYDCFGCLLSFYDTPKTWKALRETSKALFEAVMSNNAAWGMENAVFRVKNITVPKQWEDGWFDEISNHVRNVELLPLMMCETCAFAWFVCETFRSLKTIKYPTFDGVRVHGVRTTFGHHAAYLESFAASVSTNKSVTTLDLSGNVSLEHPYIVKALHDMIKQTTSVTKLKIEYNYSAICAIILLTKALVENPCLREVSFARSSIKPHGSIGVTANLFQELQWGITAAGWRDFIGAARNLQKLNIKQCALESDVADGIARAISEHPNRIELKYSGNYFDYGAACIIARAICARAGPCAAAELYLRNDYGHLGSTINTFFQDGRRIESLQISGFFGLLTFRGLPEFVRSHGGVLRKLKISHRDLAARPVSPIEKLPGTGATSEVESTGDLFTTAQKLAFNVGSWFTELDATVSARGIATSTNLISLDLSRSYFGFHPRGRLVGFELFVAAIGASKTLRQLVLGEIRECDAGEWNVLFGMIQKNRTITTLKLRGNGITFDSAPAISDVLLENTTLLDLDLSENNLWWCGISEITEALLKNSTLSVLRLDQNSTNDDDGEECFAEHKADALGNLSKLVRNVTVYL